MSIICKYKDCKKKAYYALTYKNPDRCKNHKENRKLQTMICGCGQSQPYFNEPGEKKAICCSKCKTETMVNVKHKKCDCRKSRPSFNEPGEKKAICCAKCKTETMIDVKHKKCKCRTIPSFNEPGEKKAICCFKCKTETMVDVINNKCNCGKSRPSFNEPGEKKAICCSKCKTETMIDVKHNKCIGQDGLCDITGNPNYRGYCTFCFSHTFPDDPLTLEIKGKSKEMKVKDFINEHFNGFIHDKMLSTGHCDCSIRRRPDHRKLIGNTLLVIETDENQHKSYIKMDEDTRYDDLFMGYAGKWIYIRFNPDKYNTKSGKKKDPDLKNRLIVLRNVIEKQIKRIQNEKNKELVERIYLFYDNYE